MGRGGRAYYPLFVDLAGRRCVVVGGGAVAQRKVTTLLQFGARVTVVSPTAMPRLLSLARADKIRYLNRLFRPGDLRGMWLVYAATDDQRVNRLVFRAASRARIFTNVVDQIPLCSFIAPAIVKQGNLVLAISTGGGSPALAKKLRRDLGRNVGKSYAQMLRLLKSLRRTAKRRLPSDRDRKRYFDRLVSGRVFALVRRGRPQQARREAQALLRALSAKNGSR